MYMIVIFLDFDKIIFSFNRKFNDCIVSSSDATRQKFENCKFACIDTMHSLFDAYNSKSSHVSFWSWTTVAHYWTFSFLFRWSLLGGGC